MVDIKSFAGETIIIDKPIIEEPYQYRLESKVISYEEALRILSYVNIDEGYKTLNDKMYPYFYRLFNVNIQEKDQTLALLGNDSVFLGDQDSITPILETPKYAEGVSYSDFMRNAKLSEKNGQLSTMYDATTFSNYYNNGQLYKKTVNLYPDDNDTGFNGESDYEFNKWDVDGDPNSILYKTKQLFRQRKIKTIISRFGTNADGGPGTSQYNGENSDPLYGESRGRNLLTKSAEQGASAYMINGYNNPYCRVWTHHYQYSKLANTIRPFFEESGNVTKNSVFHKWPQFGITDDGLSEGKKAWGWKNGNANWDKSVLDKDTGFLNITPKYKDPGKESNIHPKDCMFSIENLAWKDFDPYSFERALSWEQRGPLGGRIMWFPPYGIQFSENISTEWNENKFIGRGESVYSYINTKRGGTLDFLMVVDHPSVVDYALWDNDNPNEVSDTDLLRFFAGCDYDTVVNAAKPTPLTDEYFKFGNDEDDILSNAEKVEKDVEKTLEINTKLYFPNNYSGLWDINVFNSNPLGYLFSGTDAGIQFNDNELKMLTYDFDSIDDGFWKPVAYKTLFGENDDGFGYEVGQGTLNKGEFSLQNDKVIYINTDTGDFKRNQKIFYRIDGIPKRPGQQNDNVTVKTYKETYENIDKSRVIDSLWDKVNIEQCAQIVIPGGEIGKKGGPIYTEENVFEKLEKPITNNYASNTYGQILRHDQLNDTSTFLLNISDGENGEISFFSFSLVMADALGGHDDEIEFSEDKKIKKNDIINKYIGSSKNKTLKEFYELMTDNQNNIKEVSFVIEGNASKDGDDGGKTPKKEERNIYLAAARAISTEKIIKKLLPPRLEKANDGEQFEKKQVYKKGSGSGINSKESKKDRCASVKMTIKYTTTTDTYMKNDKDVTEQYNNDIINVGYEKTGEYVDNNGDVVAKDVENKNYLRPVFKKVENGDERKMVEYSRGKWTTLDSYKKMKQNMLSDRFDKKGVYTRALGQKDKSAVNKIRYDQEYYFFKKLKQEDPIVFQRLVDKLKYFDPAFHTMTPEGFNARLTFLHQCTRQGDTTTASDPNSTSANNLAFGRPPFCVLRIGDFYNQMIVIKTIGIDYSVSEGIMWDLNQEGIGVQPLLCKISIAFDFIGGGDLSGPVRRLQNAMSFNYYANTSLYDNRADRPFYRWDAKTGKSEFVPKQSYAYSAAKDYVDNIPTEISMDEYVSGINDFDKGYTEEEQEENLNDQIRKKYLQRLTLNE